MIEKFSQTYFFKYKFFEIVQFIYILVLLGFNLGGTLNIYIFSTIQLFFIVQIVLFVTYKKNTFSLLKNIKSIKEYIKEFILIILLLLLSIRIFSFLNSLFIIEGLIVSLELILCKLEINDKSFKLLNKYEKDIVYNLMTPDVINQALRYLFSSYILTVIIIILMQINTNINGIVFSIPVMIIFSLTGKTLLFLIDENVEYFYEEAFTCYKISEKLGRFGEQGYTYYFKNDTNVLRTKFSLGKKKKEFMHFLNIQQGTTCKLIIGKYSLIPVKIVECSDKTIDI